LADDVSRFSAVTVPAWEPDILVTADVGSQDAVETFRKRVCAGYESPAVWFGEPQAISLLGQHFAVISQDGGLVGDSIHTLGRFRWHQLFAKVRSMRLHLEDGDPPVIGASSGFANYYHWTAETLGTLLMLRALEPQRTSPVVVPKLVSGWQRQLLSLFDIRNELIEIEDSEAAIFDEARLTNLTARDYAFAPHPAILQEFRRQLPRVMVERSFGKKVYIARLDAQARKMNNEAELCDMLANYGFEIVVAGELSIEEQAKLFGNVEVVIAPHGASLTNLLYSPDGEAGPEVVELLQENYMGRGLAKLCQGKGLKYTAVINPYVDPSDYHQTSTWRVDIGFMERMIRERWG